jgi:signal transduction histidine kinase
MQAESPPFRSSGDRAAWYRRDMASLNLPPDTRSFAARAWAWRRVRVVLIAIGIPIVIQLPGWETHYWILFARWLFLGFVLLTVFALFERWPRRLPRWVARWGLQVAMVAVVIPFTTAIAYAVTTIGLDPPWYKDPSRMEGYGFMTILTLLVAPWVTVAALLRQIRGEAERQALAFELERSQLERQALDARFRLLQAQVEPHFLFNTLANVRELVESGSAQAATVLGSLITYLRAAVPRLDGPTASVRQEFELVRAYLEVMHMRMPDRLEYALDAEDSVLDLECPTTSILTLVENAVRHGIDPSEVGGRIEVRVEHIGSRIRVRVIDTGVGMRSSDAGTGSASATGTGLANLHERLRIAYGADATLRLSPLAPHGIVAEFEYPARAVRP